MILVSLMLLQAAYAPETEAVMNRARREAAETRPTPNRMDEKSVYLPPEIAAKLQQCLDAAVEDPIKGISFAKDWAGQGGGFSAGQCLGFAQARKENWVDAVMAFDEAAQTAERAGSRADAVRLWAQAGNAALAGGMTGKARGLFDKALAGGLPEGLALGEAYLDRARTLVGLNDLSSARADLDNAVRYAAEDPLAWLLSATLARRMNDLPRAARDIAEAGKRAPDDASIALETGNIAILTGDEPGAKAAWSRVLVLAPSSEQASSARAMLAQLDQPETDAGDQSR